MLRLHWVSISSRVIRMRLVCITSLEWTFAAFPTACLWVMKNWAQSGNLTRKPDGPKYFNMAGGFQSLKQRALQVMLREWNCTYNLVTMTKKYCALFDWNMLRSLAHVLIMDLRMSQISLILGVISLAYIRPFCRYPRNLGQCPSCMYGGNRHITILAKLTELLVYFRRYMPGDKAAGREWKAEQGLLVLLWAEQPFTQQHGGSVITALVSSGHWNHGKHEGQQHFWLALFLRWQDRFSNEDTPPE